MPGHGPPPGADGTRPRTSRLKTTSQRQGDSGMTPNPLSGPTPIPAGGASSLHPGPGVTSRSHHPPSHGGPGGTQLPLALAQGPEPDFAAYLAGPNREAVEALVAWARPPVDAASPASPTATPSRGSSPPDTFRVSPQESPPDAPQALTATASRLASFPGTGSGFLYLFGPAGTGKTHLLQAACRAARQAGLAAVCLPLDHPGLEPAILDELEGWDHIALDGLDAIAGQAAWENALFHLYNRLRDARRSLVVAARATPGELGIQLPDLASRLAWGPAYRLRALEERDCANLLRHSAQQRGLHLGEEVIAYLLKRCPREPDYLLKLLGRLDEATLAHKRRPTLPLIRALIEGPPT